MYYPIIPGLCTVYGIYIFLIVFLIIKSSHKLHLEKIETENVLYKKTPFRKLFKPRTKILDVLFFGTLRFCEHDTMDVKKKLL